MQSVHERFSLAGKRALVTGASKGIGVAIAAVLAEAGADIAISGRERAGLEQTAAAVRGFGRACAVIQADLGRVEEARRTAAEALAAFGGIDILVNNAGIAPLDPLLEAKAEDWDATMAVNLRAPFLLAQALAPGMIERGGGKIVNISSVAGLAAIQDHAAYCASKGGLNMLTRVMALEWGPHNLQCNAVCPTVILTPMGERAWGDPAKGGPMLAKIPLGRFGKEVEVADLVLYLASPASDLINGQSIAIDGGYTAI